MEKNIFEGAYFGKPYKTNENTIALYLGEEMGDFKYRLAIPIISDITNKQSYVVLQCDELGCSKTDIDIISEWTEEVDEEEIDAIVTKLCVENFIDSVDWKDIVCNLTYNLAQAAIEAYEIGCKAGYRKALNKN